MGIREGSYVSSSVLGFPLSRQHPIQTIQRLACDLVIVGECDGVAHDSACFLRVVSSLHFGHMCNAHAHEGLSPDGAFKEINDPKLVVFQA